MLEHKIGQPLLIFKYYGGKSRVLGTIYSLFPKHKTFIELFGGGGTVILNKEKAPVEIYNDIDSELVAIFKCLQMDELREEFLDRINHLVNSRELFDWFKTRKTEGKSIYFKAVRKYYIIQASYSANMKNYVEHPRGRLRINKLNEIASRLHKIMIVNKDYKYLLEKYNQKDTFLFIDPPYPGGRRVYKYNNFDWEELKGLLDDFKGKWMLTVSKHPFIQELFKDVNQKDLKIRYSADHTAKEKIKTEDLFFNYALPQQTIDSFF